MDIKKLEQHTFMWHGHLVTSSFPTPEAIDECNAKLLAESTAQGLPYYPYVPMMHVCASS